MFLLIIYSTLIINKNCDFIVMAEARQATPSGMDSDEKEMKSHSPTSPEIEMDDDGTTSEDKLKEERDRVHDGSETGSPRKTLKAKDKKKVF